MQRRLLIAGNWKMNKGVNEARLFVQELVKRVGDSLNCEVAVFPPFTSIPAVADVLRESHITYGAQNMHWEEKGAFTGEVSPVFLKELGCTYCIIGHSERRHFFGEGDEACNLKVRAAIAYGLRPILCCGETLQERQGGETISVIRRQLEKGLKGIAQPEFEIAYEPVWAIGTGQNATPEQAQEVHSYIRRWLEDNLPLGAKDVRIIYGGSVKPENVRDLLQEPEIDGVLVGGASLDLDDFVAIVNACTGQKGK
ncbi:MAG: triose-phosphate isomerase [candidate division WOR-3 bacterium]